MAKSQSEVNYRLGSETESCAGCEFFQPPESCLQVSGIVAPDGLCDLFISKAAAAGPDVASLENMLFGGGL